MGQTRLKVTKAENGYILQTSGEYSDGEPVIFTSVGECFKKMAEDLGEPEFAAAIIEGAAMSTAMGKICEKVLAPQILAINEKINPGIENIVDTESTDTVDGDYV